MKFSVLFLSVLFASLTVVAQTREELEKQKQQLKRELQETEKMLSDNKSKTKENYSQYVFLSDKVDIQNRLVNTIGRDIDVLDKNLTTTQRDINRFDKLLDTLKQEYAKSMVYAYKNRNNYDFLNFIFSAGSFNDAIKRIAYLKSYRNYREMQGQNILRTQELRRNRLEELTGIKQKKNIVLQSKDKELSILEDQQKEKDRVLSELKKQGKTLSGQYAAKAKQLKKVDNAIAANIKRVIEEARKAAAKKAADEEAKRLAAKKLADAEAKRLADLAKAAEKNSNNTGTKTTVTKAPTVVRATPVVKNADEGSIVTDENRALNNSFIANKGSLPWPVNGRILTHFGVNIMPDGTKQVNQNTTIATEVGANVKAIFNGVVSQVIEDESGGIVMIQHGGYFTTYSNVSNISVKKGQQVNVGQVLAKAMANFDGIGTVDFYLYDAKAKYFDPEKWLHR